MTFNERYEQMRGTSAPPPASAIDPVESPVVVDLPAGDTPKPEEATPEASEPPQSSEATAKPAATEQTPEQKRIADLERENRELKAKPSAPAGESKPAAAATPAAAAAPADLKPEVEKFATYEEYLAELSRWTYRDEQRKQEISKSVEAGRAQLKQRFDAAAAKHADFHEVAQRQIPVSDTIVSALQESEHAGELFYYLGTHEQEAREIAALSPLAATRRLLAIESQFAAPPPAASAPAPAASETQRPAQSRAPKPPTTVRAASMPPSAGIEDVVKLPDKDRFRRFTELRAKQGQKDAKRLVATR